MEGKTEEERVLEDHQWWKGLESLLGWKLYGFNGRHSAAFIGHNSREFIELTREDAQDIFDAVEQAKKVDPNVENLENDI